MQTAEFYQKVRDQLCLTDDREAETASRVVLAALADRVTPDERHDLASQLPKELNDLVKGRGGAPQKMDMDTFISRIQGDLDLMTWKHAADVSRGVFSVVKEAVSEGEWEDIASQLPRELQDMFLTA